MSKVPIKHSPVPEEIGKLIQFIDSVCETSGEWYWVKSLEVMRSLDGELELYISHAGNEMAIAVVVGSSRRTLASYPLSDPKSLLQFREWLNRWGYFHHYKATEKNSERSIRLNCGV